MNTMKTFYTLLATLMITTGAIAQSAIGTWKTIDDETGKVKSHVKITEEGGKLVGKVAKLINPDFTTCSACSGDKKDQPIQGMTILWDLEKESSTEWEGGKIMDPKNGKEYKCYIELTDANTLNVRGYIGFALLGRTQTWQRVAD